MSTVKHMRRAAAVVFAALILLTTVLVAPASAHGSTINPMSRNYGCWKRWGSDFQNPIMATEDPMCWQAWQADSTAMWNWNSLYREGVAGNHQGAIPDGQLCSGGRTGGMRYAALDNPGAWKATNLNNSFTWTMHDQAKHGADYIRIYVTRQGYNPLTTALRWSDLELRKDTGRILPGVGEPSTDPVLNGVSISTDVSAPGRTGRHIVYAIWQASHSDQSYYFCSDVIFPGGQPDPTTSPTPTPTTPAPTTPAPTTPAPTTPGPGTGSCSATYAITGQWNGGFQAEVRVAAGAAAIRGWTVTWTYANGQTVAQSWNTTITSSGSTVTARNVSYNGTLGAGASTTFGLLGSWTGTNTAPTLSCTATT
jgi:predicted carbohydrate-binding protein with CBM5 and CBM33 domain